MNASGSGGGFLVATRRRAGAALATGTAVLLLAPTLPATAASGPPAPVRLPAASEGWAAYVPQTSCDPVAKPGVRKFRDLMLGYYKRGTAGGIIRGCTVGTSEHSDGRAYDWMLDSTDTAERATATRALAWLLAPGADGTRAVMARRLGIMYIIWNGKIWSSYRSAEGWRTYTGSNPHRDHIHTSFTWEGAMGRTSFWTGRVAARDYGPCRVYVGDPARIYVVARSTPCPTPYAARYTVTRPTVWYGSRNASVTRAQIRLGSTVTGYFGPITRGVVITYQRAHGVPVTGAVDPTTWAVLDPSTIKGSRTPPPPSGSVLLKPGMSGDRVRFLQTKLGALPQYRTGYYGSITTGYVRDFQASVRLAVTGTVDQRTWDALTPRTTRVLRYGMSGSDVKLLQTNLGMATKYRTGYFGTLTQSAVKAFQTRHKLVVSGMAYAATRAWNRM